jgi:hypothetical protein
LLYCNNRYASRQVDIDRIGYFQVWKLVFSSSMALIDGRHEESFEERLLRC